MVSAGGAGAAGVIGGCCFVGLGGPHPIEMRLIIASSIMWAEGPRALRPTWAAGPRVVVHVGCSRSTRAPRACTGRLWSRCTTPPPTAAASQAVACRGRCRISRWLGHSCRSLNTRTRALTHCRHTVNALAVAAAGRAPGAFLRAGFPAVMEGQAGWVRVGARNDMKGAGGGASCTSHPGAIPRHGTVTVHDAA